MHSSCFYLGSMWLEGKITFLFPAGEHYTTRISLYPVITSSSLTTSTLPEGINTVALTYRFPGVKKQSISSILAGLGFTFGAES